jgi:hypothetical protein
MSKKDDFRDVRRELKEALEMMRKEVHKVRKDLATATKTWMKTTGRFVQDVTPKVSATIDETIEQSSEAFRKAVASVGKETKRFQVGFLRSYKTVLSKQMDFIEKRLKELTK